MATISLKINIVKGNNYKTMQVGVKLCLLLFQLPCPCMYIIFSAHSEFLYLWLHSMYISTLTFQRELLSLYLASKVSTLPLKHDSTSCGHTNSSEGESRVSTLTLYQE